MPKPIKLDFKPVDQVQTADEASDIAKEYQRQVSETTQTWGDCAEASVYFEELAKKFGLEEEFKENGII